MKKQTVFLIIGIVLSALAACFVCYAFGHPEASFPWSNSITYALLAVYALLTAGMFVLSALCRKRGK